VAPPHFFGQAYPPGEWALILSGFVTTGNGAAGYLATSNVTPATGYYPAAAGNSAMGYGAGYGALGTMPPAVKVGA